MSFSAISHMLLIIPGFYFFHTWFVERDFQVKKSAWILLAMAIVMVISLIVNRDIVDSLFRSMLKTRYFFIAFLSYFSFFYIKKNYLNERRISILIHIFLISTTIASCSGIVASFSGYNILKMKEACHPFRACGLYGMYMTYGYGIGLFMVLLSGMLIYWKDFQKWVSPKLLCFVWVFKFSRIIFKLRKGCLDWIFSFSTIFFL